MTTVTLTLPKELVDRIAARRNEGVTSYLINAALLHEDLARATKSLAERGESIETCPYLRYLGMLEGQHLDEAEAHVKRCPICAADLSHNPTHP